MDSSSNDDFVSEIPENADMILFAEDLVEYIMFLNSPNYVSEKDGLSDELSFRVYIYNKFNSITRKAIHFLQNILEITHADTFRIMKSANLVTAHDYWRFSTFHAETSFSAGFNAKKFFIFCVNISKLAADFYNHGVLIAPELAKTHIINILHEYDRTTDVWDAIHKTAEMLEAMRVNRQTPQSIYSNEIEALNQSEDEVSGDNLTSSSMSEEENILSENGEDNFEDQKNVLSKQKRSLRKVSTCSSDISSEIDLNSLKLSESSSSTDDTSPTSNFERRKRTNRSGSKYMLKPGTSSIDQRNKHGTCL